MSEIRKETHNAVEQIARLPVYDRMMDDSIHLRDNTAKHKSIIQSAIDQATTSLLSRLQASEGEVAELKKQLCVQANLFKDIEFHEARIAELEKLCGEAAEVIREHNAILQTFRHPHLLVLDAIAARLQAAQPGSEKAIYRDASPSRPSDTTKPYSNENRYDDDPTL